MQGNSKTTRPITTTAPPNPRRDPIPRWKSRLAAEQSRTAALRFSPTAWAKLLFLRDLGEIEVGGFGITSAEDLLLVQDVHLVRQSCTAASVAFDDASVADFFDEHVDLGLKPEQFGRLWVHTHPGESPG